MRMASTPFYRFAMVVASCTLTASASGDGLATKDLLPGSSGGLPVLAQWAAADRLRNLMKGFVAQEETLAHEIVELDEVWALIQGVALQQGKLALKVQGLRGALEEARSRCPGCNGGPAAPFKPLPGLCASFGDPHFTTFDGAHTILLKEDTIWLVKSEHISIQALSKHVTGDLMGIAVGGSFLKGHTFIFYNHTLSDSQSKGPFTALFDDEPILNEWDTHGNAEFNKEGTMWAARRADWDSYIHDERILGMKPAIEFDVGNWTSRFTNAPRGGIYRFKFPDGVEITATGVDLMSSVIKMSKAEGGQSGYCGNFNGDPMDEFKPPAPGSVPDVIAPAWNSAVGEGLESVPDDLNLFRKSSSSALQKLLLPAVPAGNNFAADLNPCPQDVLGEAEKQCSKVEEGALRAACIVDVCKTGSGAVTETLALDTLEKELEEEIEVKS